VSEKDADAEHSNDGDDQLEHYKALCNKRIGTSTHTERFCFMLFSWRQKNDFVDVALQSRVCRDV
jgi:hypothetical protein